MSIHVLSKAPTSADFTPLTEHEASTPHTFFGAKPVLHTHIDNCDILFSPSASAQESFKEFLESNIYSEDGDKAADADSLRRGITVFVTSESLLLSSPSSTASAPGLSIPYPAISLHATQSLRKTTASPPQYSHDPHLPNGNEASESATAQPSEATTVSAVYLQIDPLFSARANMNPDEDDGDDAGLEIQIVPPEHSQVEAGETENGQGGARGGSTNAAVAKSIFEALSRCADLHPDPAVDEDEDGEGAVMGGLGGMPGQGGWITSENMQEFDFQDADEYGDEDGVVDDGLGPGAGIRRARDEGGDENGHVEADGNGEEESKWQRTS